MRILAVMFIWALTNQPAPAPIVAEAPQAAPADPAPVEIFEFASSCPSNPGGEFFGCWQ